MRNFLRTVAGSVLTGTAFLAALGLAASPASAAVSSIVVTGANLDGHFTATASNPSFTDRNTGAKLTCTSSTAQGTIFNGTYTTAKIGTVNTITWSNCKLNSLAFAISSGSLPWDIDVTGPTVGGVTPMSLPQVQIHLGGTCNATIAGSVTGHYTNSTHSFTVDGGSLTVSSVSGICLGLLNNGDPITFNAVYVVTDPATLTVNAS